MDISILKEVGLTDGEIKVYLALLELGSSTTGPMINKSGIARSIIYQILEKLMQKGLVSQIIKEKTKYFQAAEPNRILGYIDEREKQLDDNKKKIEKLLPELLLKQKMAPKSETNMYFGFKGIRTAHEHLYLKLKRGEEYCYLGVPAYQPEEQHLYWKRDALRRIKAGIKFRALMNRDTDPEILKNRNSYLGTDARYMPEGIKTPACFMTFKDTTIIILQSPTAIAVEIINQDIADSFQAYFEEFWKRSNPFKSKP
ncbi:MAG TPA: helix-turn-helix domain-containing protein [Candidatus Nanoarchaeia archaeon]|nr:helix-turn-helix domain-containing protein [Candidatus Nanoarchaeia archaeon]